jgi:hypothetical protein
MPRAMENYVRGKISVVREETITETVGMYTSRMKCCHVYNHHTVQAKSGLSIAAMIREQCEKMKCNLMRTLFTIRHNIIVLMKQMLESDRVSDRVVERSGPREDILFPHENVGDSRPPEAGSVFGGLSPSRAFHRSDFATADLSTLTPRRSQCLT